MKKIFAALMVLGMLCACTGQREELDRAMKLRAELLGCHGCSFTADITADYADAIHTFSMDCETDNHGQLRFTVTEPKSIAGITGQIDAQQGQLTFDDVALSFPLLADQQITPVSAPWIFMKTLRGGYLSAVCSEEELLRLTIDDSYEENALQMEIWLDGQDIPVFGEILYEGRRILSMSIEQFRIL